MEGFKYKELTDSIIQAFYCVYNELLKKNPRKS